MSVECGLSGRSSSRLEEGLNDHVVSFVLDAKRDGETDNMATISFEGFTNEGDASLWESGDFMVHMTFLFSLHLEPQAETEISPEGTPLGAAPALKPDETDFKSETSESSRTDGPLSISDKDDLEEAKPAEDPPGTLSEGDSGPSGESAPLSEIPEAL